MTSRPEDPADEIELENESVRMAPSFFWHVCAKPIGLSTDVFGYIVKRLECDEDKARLEKELGKIAKATGKPK